jgi:hypothetical protein
MNMISTGAFLNEMDASNKQPTMAESFAAVWEKKNAKAARAGGVSLMALSLAACGSSSTTTSSTTTTTTTTTATSQSLSLTSKADTITGGAGDDTIDGGAVNEGGVANVQTLGATDSIDGGAGTDTLTFEYSVATTPLSITNVEHIRMTDIDAGNEAINLVNVSGMTELSIIGNSTLGDVDNIANIVTVNLTNTTGGANIDYAAAAVAGTADVQTVNIQSTTAGTLTVDAGIETLTLVSAGGQANTLAAVSGSMTTLNISGAQNLTITGALGTAITTVSAGDATGNLTLTQTGAQVSNITTGSGDDTIDLSGNFVDGTTAASRDVVAAGAGTDKLILSAAEAAAVTSVAQFSTVTGIETVAVDTDGDSNNISMVNLGVTTLEFDSTVGAHTVTAVSGGEVQFDAADTGNDARTYQIAGTATDDSLTFDINGVDIGGGAQTITGIETLTIATSGTAVLDGTFTMTATAATETLNITGTAGTLTLGNITADKVDSSGFSGTSVTMGTLQQLTNVVGGSSAETVVGSTSADIFSMGAGADFLQNTVAGAVTTANDIMTGGAGFDTFTLVGNTAGTATNYLGAPNITDFTVGTSSTTTDLLRFSADNSSYNDDGDAASGIGDAAAADGAANGDSVVIQTVALNASAAAVSGATVNCIKLTTSTAFTTNVQSTFNAAIGSATVTGLTADSQLLALMHDSTNNKMVVMTIDVNGGTTTAAETGDVVELVATVDMTAADYALIDGDNFATFIA